MIRTAFASLLSALLTTTALAQEQKPEPMPVGALLPMTGGLQAYGAATLNGLKLAAEEITTAGFPIELKVGDTQTTPQPGVDAAQKLVSVEKVRALVGPMSSGVTIPVATTVSKPAGILTVSPSATSPVITGLDDGDTLFRTVPSDALQGTALADLVAQKGVKTVSVLYVNNDYGRGLADTFANSFKGKAGKIAASLPYEEKQAAYRGELRRAASGGAEALVLIGYPEDGQTILRQALEGGFFTRFIFTDGMKTPEIIKNLGAQYLEGAFGTSPEALSDSQPAKIFNEAYAKKYGDRPPLPYIDAAYDALYLVALAAVKAGSTEPAAIRNALRDVANAPGEKVLPGEFKKGMDLLKAGKDIDYVGAAGPADFDGRGDVTRGTFAHWEIRDGKIETVKVFDPAEK